MSESHSAHVSLHIRAGAKVSVRFYDGEPAIRIGDYPAELTIHGAHDTPARLISALLPFVGLSEDEERRIADAAWHSMATAKLLVAAHRVLPMIAEELDQRQHLGLGEDFADLQAAVEALKEAVKAAAPAAPAAALQQEVA